ncbi:MAG: hypothetical protein FWE14_06865 [Lachnospiraceae bacterium]|nr:hypothetical protein [Lachnospiraceae bacterium]
MLKNKRILAFFLAVMLIISVSFVAYANTCASFCRRHITVKNYETQNRVGTCINCGRMTEGRLRSATTNICYDINANKLKEWIDYGSWTAWTHPCKQSALIPETQ